MVTEIIILLKSVGCSIIPRADLLIFNITFHIYQTNDSVRFNKYINE